MERSYIDSIKFVENPSELPPQKQVMFEHAIKTALILKNKLHEQSYSIFSELLEKEITYTNKDMNTLLIEFKMTALLKVLYDMIQTTMKALKKEHGKNFILEMSERVKDDIRDIFEKFGDE